jgi:hypothetical protein
MAYFSIRMIEMRHKVSVRGSAGMRLRGGNKKDSAANHSLLCQATIHRKLDASAVRRICRRQNGDSLRDLPGKPKRLKEIFWCSDFGRLSLSHWPTGNDDYLSFESVHRSAP